MGIYIWHDSIIFDADNIPVLGIDALLGKKIIGTFNLRNELKDYTKNEENLVNIISAVHSFYIEKTKELSSLFMVEFKLTKDENKISIAVYIKENTNSESILLGKIPLSTVRDIGSKFSYLIYRNT
jgi:hypothetical protein